MYFIILCNTKCFEALFRFLGRRILLVQYDFSVLPVVFLINLVQAGMR